MSRTVAALLTAFVLLPTARANISALSWQNGAGKKDDPATRVESKEKIVADIQADYEKVLERLNKNDPGLQTRENQKRILENIDKLLQQRPPQGSAKSNPVDTSPLRSINPGAKEPNPMPQIPARQAEPKEQPPAPIAQQNDTPSATKPKVEVRPGPGSEKPRTFEEMKQEAINDPWTLPPRLRQEMDVFARERFIRNYEEMLRAYYRNIAESGRR
jgi:hypothetical protein